MNIGAAIKKIRLEKEISQGDLSKSCEISQTSFSQIENGIKRPSTNTLNKICKALDVPETIIYLYALEDSDIPTSKKEVFKVIFPAVEDMIKKLIVEDK
jgi:transcriptional regulator with XRE-family HTH domain